MNKDVTERRAAELARAQLAAIVEFSDDAILSKDLDGYILTWNRAAERLYGYTAEEIVGRLVSILMPADRPDEFSSIMERLKRGEHIDHYETVRVHKDGHRIQVSVSISPLSDSDGNLIGAASIARDVGSRKELEAARDQSQHQLQLTTDAVPLLIAYIDATGRYRFCNHCYEEWFQIPRDRVVGHHVEEVLGPSCWEAIRPNAERALAGETVTVDSTHAYPDGKVRFVRATYTPDVNRTGEVRGLVISVSDLTDRRNAEQRREEATDRITRLQHITAALSEALTPDQVAEVVVHQAVDALGAWAGLVGLVEGDTFRVLNSTGYRETVIESWQGFPISGPYPVSEAVRTRQPVWITSPEEYRERYPAMASAVNAPTLSAAMIPLLVEGQARGALVLSFAQSQRFRQEDREFIQALAHQCAQALERSRLYDAERRARQEAEEARRRSAFLAEASVALSSSLDYETTVANVTRSVVPDLADWCVVHLLEKDGSLNTIAVSHADPAKVAWAMEVQKRYPPALSPDQGLGLVLRTGETAVYNDITDEMVAQTARDEEHGHILREIGVRSVLMAPLVARAHTLGVLTFIRSRGSWDYTAADRSLAEDLARRCALAVDNARLFRESQELNRTKDEFLAMLAHELRNPIGAISNALLLLEQVGSDGPHAVKYRGIASRQLRHITRLMDDLLDVSRITRGKVRLRREPVSLSTVVESAVQATQPAFNSRRHHLGVDLPREPVWVQGDPDRLEQVVSNLLHNAAKYTPDGGRIAVCLETAAGQAVVRVRDNGTGIPKELLPHIFELFTQADRSLDRPEGGLGIGLTLVKNLVEMHGGTVQVSSEGPGRGSEFAVKIPLLPREEAPEPHTGNGCQEEAPAPVRRVLIVEDNLDAAQTLSEILQMWGHTVRAAPDGPTALRMFEDCGADVVLLDIGLPGMDGFEVGRRLRALEGGDRPMLVALSGYSQPEDRARSRKTGFDSHLPKPVDPAALRKLLSTERRQIVPSVETDG